MMHMIRFLKKQNYQFKLPTFLNYLLYLFVCLKLTQPAADHWPHSVLESTQRYSDLLRKPLDVELDLGPFGLAANTFVLDAFIAWVCMGTGWSRLGLLAISEGK